ncbi:MAG: ABC transporter ATP-binding protein [Firmicutes bacterium]|nr:ABC transporter ATP-binding protein [Bacillota bacterium]
METLLEMKAITKVYPNGVMANDRVDFQVNKGEIHALVGENGAGKTTLMKVLFGLEVPDGGEVYYKGKPLQVTSPLQAIRNGIGMVHQHFMLAPSLTVTENLVLGVEPRKGLAFDWDQAVQTVTDLSKRYNLPVDPLAKIENIPIGMRQKVEILKALLRGAELLVLDEPTAVLTPQETEELFTALVGLKEQGHTMIFISHKLNEVKQITDRITVMRGGRIVGVRDTAEVSEADISRLMVGRDVILKIDKPPAKPQKRILEVQSLSYFTPEGKALLQDVSFSVRAGEIVGIAGVEGNGQRELVEILTGLRRPHGGVISVDGYQMRGSTPRQMRDLGVAHIPEDRMLHGVANEASIEENLIADRVQMPEYTRKIFLKTEAIASNAQTLVTEFNVRTRSPKTPIKMLSGGNIQKVVVAREFSSNPRLVIANQPTRGVDVGAIEFIHKKLVEICRAGAAVLLISADLNEVMSVSDRLLVIYGGQIVAAFPEANEVSEEELGLYMLGIQTQGDTQLKEALA